MSGKESEICRDFINLISLLKNNNGKMVVDSNRIDNLWKTLIYPSFNKLRSQKSPNTATFALTQIGAFLEILLLQGYTLPCLWEEVDFLNEQSLLGVAIDQPHAIANDDLFASKLHIYSGDVCRYINDSNNALYYYMTSYRLDCTSPMPLNQMGVIFHNGNNHLLAMHFYIRAYFHQEQYPMAKNNLEKLLKGRTILSELVQVYVPNDYAQMLFPYTEHAYTVYIITLFGLFKLELINTDIIKEAFESILSLESGLDVTTTAFLLLLNEPDLVNDMKLGLRNWFSKQESFEKNKNDTIVVDCDFFEQLGGCTLFTQVKPLMKLEEVGINSSLYSISNYIAHKYELINPLIQEEEPIREDEDVVTFKRLRPIKGPPKAIGSERKTMSPAPMEITSPYELFPKQTPGKINEDKEEEEEDKITKLGMNFSLKPGVFDNYRNF